MSMLRIAFVAVIAVLVYLFCMISLRAQIQIEESGERDIALPAASDLASPMPLDEEPAVKHSLEAESPKQVENQNLLIVETEDGIAGYSKTLGTWDRVQIEGDERLRNAIVSQNFASVIIGDQLYGFSSESGKWGAMTIPKEHAGTGGPTHSENLLTIVLGEATYVFSPQKAEWTSPTEATEATKEEMPDISGTWQMPEYENGYAEIRKSPVLARSFVLRRGTDRKQPWIDLKWVPERDRFEGYQNWPLDAQAFGNATYIVTPNDDLSLLNVELRLDEAAQHEFELLAEKLAADGKSREQIEQHLLHPQWHRTVSPELVKLFKDDSLGPPRYANGPDGAVELDLVDVPVQSPALATPEMKRLQENIAALEKRSAKTASEIRAIVKKKITAEPVDEAKLAELRDNLKITLTEALDLKLKLEAQQAKHLESRLTRLNGLMEQRKSLRDQIIDRRMHELLDTDATRWNGEIAAKSPLDIPISEAIPYVAALKSQAPNGKITTDLYGGNGVYQSEQFHKVVGELNKLPYIDANIRIVGDGDKFILAIVQDPSQRTLKDGELRTAITNALAAANIEHVRWEVAAAVPVVPQTTPPTAEFSGTSILDNETITVLEVCRQLAAARQRVATTERTFKKLEDILGGVPTNSYEMQSLRVEIELSKERLRLVTQEHAALVQDLELQIKGAELELKTAETVFKRAQALFDAGGNNVRADAVDEARLRRDQVELKLKRLQNQMEFLKKAGASANEASPASTDTAVSRSNAAYEKMFAERRYLSHFGTYGAIKDPRQIPDHQDRSGLKLYGEKITDDDLQPLAGCNNLTSFSMCDVNVEGPGLANLGSPSNLTMLNLVGPKATDKWLAHFPANAHLKHLSLYGSAVTDAGLAYLHKFPNLKSLDLSETAIGDEGLAVLQLLPQLQSLTLANTQVSDGGLAMLAHVPHLKTFFLASPHVRGPGLAVLQDLKELSELSFTTSCVTNEWLAAVAPLRSVEWFQVKRSKVTSDGLAHISGWENLTHLDLNLNSINDSAIEHLKRFGRLKIVEMIGTKITPAGLEKLRQALPDTDIRVDPEVQQPNRSSAWREHFYSYAIGTQITFPQHLSKSKDDREITLSGDRFTNAELAQLAYFDKLHALNLANLNVDGSALASLGSAHKLRKLRFFGPKVTDQWLEHLPPLPELDDLVLTGGSITNNGLSHVKKFPRLETLILTDTSIGDEGMKALEFVPELKTLWLKNTQVSDKGLQYLSYVPHLTQFSLASPNVEGNELARLADMNNLTTVQFTGESANDEWMKAIEPLQHIVHFELHGTSVTSEGISSLRRWRNLRNLTLNNNPHLDDDAVDHLQELESLQLIELNGTAFTPDGVERLRQALPEIRIIFNPVVKYQPIQEKP